MSERDQQRHFCAVQLAGLIVQANQRDPVRVEIADAVCMIDNIVDYAIAVAHDRAAQAMANAAAKNLTEAILKKHITPTPAPETP